MTRAGPVLLFREVASNILIHREYASGVSARMIIEYGRVITENANRAHGFGLLNPETAAPFPKNPVLGAFFREIDRADELGSGMRNMMLYGKKYGGEDPQLIEGDIFRMYISVPEFKKTSAIISKIVTSEKVTQQVTQQVLRLLSACVGEMSRAELMKEVDIRDRVSFARNYLEPSLEKGLMEMTQPDSPNSPTQKYRLTEKGKLILE